MVNFNPRILLIIVSVNEWEDSDKNKDFQIGLKEKQPPLNNV